MKKQSTLKRALALGMSATMVSATLAGCGGSASSTAATSTETASSATTEAEATTDSDKPFAGTTLTWYTTLNGNVSDNFANLGDTPWAKYVEEQTGITIEFQHPTQGSEAEEFAVMLASGEYPDIIEYRTDWHTLWSIPEPRYLTSEGLQCGKRFTGAMVGLYVHGTSAVRFADWVAVWPHPEEKR